MKTIIVGTFIAGSILLTGCTPPLQEQTPQVLSGVPGLEDCIGLKFEDRTYVFRCPGSVTSTSQTISNGKSTSHINSVVDDLHSKVVPKTQSATISPNGLNPYQQCVIAAVQNNKPIEYISQACDVLK